MTRKLDSTSILAGVTGAVLEDFTNSGVFFPLYQGHAVTQKSGSRLAVIAGPWMSRMFTPMTRCVKPSTSNWKDVFNESRPDYILVESFLAAEHESWRMSQIPGTQAYQKLLDLLRYAKEHDIPTVYWLTEVAPQEYYRSYAAHFDLVACAYEHDVEILASKGMKTVYCPACVQPALFHPFVPRQIIKEKKIIPALFDDGYAFSKVSDVIRRDLLTLGVLIAGREEPACLSGEEAGKKKMAFIGTYPAFLWPDLLRSANILLSAGNNTDLAAFQWKALAAQACGVPVLFLNNAKKTATPSSTETVHNNVAHVFSNEEFWHAEILRMVNDEAYQRESALPAWRAALREHSLQLRLSLIESSLGLSKKELLGSSVTLIEEISSQDDAIKALGNYQLTNWPCKELLLLPLKNSDSLGADIDAIISNTGMPHVKRLPCMPDSISQKDAWMLALNQASGDYSIFLDNHCAFTPDFATDALLAAQQVGADIFWPAMKSSKARRMTCMHMSDVIANEDKYPINPHGLGGRTSFLRDAVFRTTDSYTDEYSKAADAKCAIMLDEINATLTPTDPCVL